MYTNPSAYSWSYAQTIDPRIEEFHRSLPDYTETQLVSLPEQAQELGLDHVLVKAETQRLGLPAFKIMGASWAIYQALINKLDMQLMTPLEELGVEAKKAQLTLVASSEGNWGRSVARMGRYLGISVTVYVPQSMSQATQDKIASEGATVLKITGDYDESVKTAERVAKETGAILVMDTAWDGYEQIPQWVTDGYTTILNEADRQAEALTGKPVNCVIVSVGVGSWAHAVTAHYKGKPYPVRVIAVEPKTAACLQTSLKADKIVPIETQETIMNGMCCGTVSSLAWPVLRSGIDACVDISDQQSHEMVEYLRANGVNAGPCGAAPLAALKQLREEDYPVLDQNAVALCLCSEGCRDYPVPKEA